MPFSSFAQILVLAADLHFLELAQTSQPHVEDGFSLHFGELERLDQRRLRLVLVADDPDHLVDVQIGNQQAAENLQPALDLGLAMVGPTDQHVAQMVKPFAQALRESHHLGHTALDQHVEVQRNLVFELRQPEQRFHHQRRIDILRLRLDYDTDVFGRLVPDVSDQRQLLLVQQFGDLLDQARLLHQKGYLGDDDDPGAACALFLLPSGADAERAAAGGIGFSDRLLGIDADAAGREIRALDPFQQRLGFRVGLLDQMQRGFAELGGVVRRDRGRHADRDTLRAIGEQVREAAGQHDGLFRLAVVIRAELDPVLVDAVEQKPRDVGQPRFGVAVGSGIIAVDIAEIALAVDKRIARGEVLREADHGVVDRLVAMRMERAHHVADDFGGFFERRAGVEPEQPHAVEDAPVHRLQAVAGIGQRAVHDGRKRVGKIALFQRLTQRHVVNFGRFLRRNQSFSHAARLNRGSESGKDRLVPCGRPTGRPSLR
ncbi:hypothetical protein ACVWWG_008061 [Bradyrhizobium sp. LB7.2]